MKITAVLLLAAVTAVSAKGYSQDTKITLSLNRVNLIRFFKAVEKESGARFVFSNDIIPSENFVVINVKQTPVSQVLNKVLSPTNLKYRFDNETGIIVISEKEEGERNKTNSAKPITGRVTNEAGEGMAGVTVNVKGTSKTTVTKEDGSFSIAANEGDVLLFSSVGYQNMEMRVGANNEVSIKLSVSNLQLNEVVVTALGIQRKAKSLTYSTQKLNGSELSTVKDANVINALAGKAAGVTITRSTSGIGGSARVIMRGNKSTRENQPLYVIDGVPVANFSPAQPTDVWGQSSGAGSGGRDGGDGISNINPDDIESINILKGASASALYGSQAANGVIMITTKHGKTGTGRLEYSSNYTWETPLLQPALQYRYAQTTPATATTTGTAESWGAKTSVPDHVKDFFQTGGTWINSVAFSGGNQMAQTYFSYSNTSSKGIMPTSKFDRHTFNFRETLKLFSDKLSVDGNIIFVTQNNHNRAVSGMYNNPLTGLYLFPRGLDFNSYKNNFEYYSPIRNMNLQNWWNINYDKGYTGDDNQQNPYWALYRNLRDDSRDRAQGSLTLRYQLTPTISLQARGSFDKSYDKYELKSYAGTQSVLAASNGRYTLERSTNTQLYGDVIATANEQLSRNLHLTANLGASITDLKGNDRIFFDTDPTADPGLGYANKFSVSNILPTALFSTASMDRKQVQSVFASTQFSLMDHIFVDLTGRNDWSSALAFTPKKNSGFFYYSAGLTTVLSEMFSMPEPISFSKVRISYSSVGNDVTAYATNPPYKYIQTSGGDVRPVLNTKAPVPGTYLQPEDNRSFEVGTEWRFLRDRIGFDVTYYKNNNYRQYMEIPAPLGSGYSTYYLNLGNIQNSGFEAIINAVPYSSGKLRWTSTINMAANTNKVLKLSDANIPGANADNPFTLTDFGVNMFASKIKEGGSWGDIYTNKQILKNADGALILDADGKPQTQNIGTGIFIGNPNPKFTAGWNNAFDFGKLTVSFLIDGRFGGKVMSLTQAVLDKYGVSEASAAARDNGGVQVAAVSSTGAKVTTVDAQKYYSSLGGRDGAGEAYIYDATNIRLREMAVTYGVPSFWKHIKEIRVGLVGRNLFFFSKKAPFDPETSMSTGNGLQGVDVFGLPATRSIGANLKFIF